jgi:aryl-phospho-beta-D-glucosidase BglC (GH1 family)
MKKQVNAIIAAGTCLLAISTAANAQLPTPSKGWNLGNTLEPNCGVGCWGPQPTQALINSVAAQGFNTVRIPCAWMSNSTNGTINSAYMSQVTQVVNWCTAKGLYVIINDHWDGGWFEDNGFAAYDSTLNSKLQNIWTQVANNFKNYDSHVLFACANEPNANTQAGTGVLFQYYQNWVNMVRATGGNNSTRWLIVQGPSVSIDDSSQWVTMPTDPAKHMMIEVHYYDPFQFTQLTSDASWGAMFYFWGSGYHVTSGPTNRNATWGEESTIDTEFAKMQTTFVNKGVPVLLGEYRASPKPTESDLTGQYVTQNYNSCTYWNYYVHNKAVADGLYATAWDIPQQMFDWTTGNVLDQNMINAVQGNSFVAPVAGLGGAAPAFTATASASPSTIAPGATGTINTSVTDTGGATSNLVVDIEVYNSAGTKVAQQTYSGQNFTGGGTNTYNWSWTAPTTTGTYTVSVGVFNSTWSTTYYWGSNAATTTVANSDSAQYNFETGTQSWTSTGGMICGLSSSTTQAVAGTHALAVAINSTGSGSQQVYISAPSTAAGKTITFHVWIPSGSAISSIQPYVQQGSAGSYAWTGNWQAIGSLQTNAWNTLTVTVPSNAATPLNSLGVQFSSSGAWTGTCYIDSVSW